MGFRLTFDFDKDAFSKVQIFAEQRIAAAATAAMRETAERAKAAGRQAIAAGGFSGRWQNALRSKVYPQSGTSLSPAAVIWDNIDYADVFEEGATITGSKLLWLPLDSVPRGPGGKHLSPSEMVGFWGKLISLKHHDPPILAAAIRETDKQAGKRLNVRKIRTGGNKSGGTVRIIPLYVGVKSVTDPQRFDIIGAVEAAAAQFGEIFASEFED
jgi:hypothetical protein